MTFETHWASEHFDPVRPSRDMGANSNRRCENTIAAHWRDGLDDILRQPRREPAPASAANARRPHGRSASGTTATGTSSSPLPAPERRSWPPSTTGSCVRTRQQRSLAPLRRPPGGDPPTVTRDVSSRSNATDRSARSTVGGASPSGRHVFAMIQSFRRSDSSTIDRRRIRRGDRRRVSPRRGTELRPPCSRTCSPPSSLGLTATPERHGRRRRHSSGSTAGSRSSSGSGRRSTVAFLVPFQYFGIADTVDFSQVTWRRGGYDTAELGQPRYRQRDSSAGVPRKLSPIARLAADDASTGFLRLGRPCASTWHGQFSKHGFEIGGHHGRDDPSRIARSALQRLRLGQLRCIFSVDVLGEGVDVPNVDTVILLRPTAVGHRVLAADRPRPAPQRGQGRAHDRST